MKLFDEETLEFLEALQQNNVRYLLIGGFAVNMHVYQRPAADLDIWLEDTAENRQRLRSAFANADLGDYPMIETMQFVPGWTDFQLNNAMRLDILTELKGLEACNFDDCLQISPVEHIEGVQIPFLQIDHLIANKTAVGRPKDLSDIAALERFKAQQRESPTMFSR